MNILNKHPNFQRMEEDESKMNFYYSDGKADYQIIVGKGRSFGVRFWVSNEKIMTIVQAPRWFRELFGWAKVKFSKKQKLRLINSADTNEKGLIIEDYIMGKALLEGLYGIYRKFQIGELPYYPEWTKQEKSFFRQVTQDVQKEFDITLEFDETSGEIFMRE